MAGYKKLATFAPNVEYEAEVREQLEKMVP
jgi:hypothetical protein